MRHGHLPRDHVDVRVTIEFPQQGDTQAAKFTGTIDCAKTSFFLDGRGEFTKL